MTDSTLLNGDFLLEVEGAVRVLQITDTHLMSERGGQLLNVDTDASLAAVVDLASKGPQADFALITGDIAGDGAGDAYERFAKAIEPLKCPSAWLPGNHDDAALKFADRFLRRIRTPYWDIVMLNSQVLSEVGGRLSHRELRALEVAVDEAVASEKHLLVAMHHPLLPMGCAWLDPQRIGNADEVFSILDAKITRVVICGHVHQESDTMRGDIRLMSAPSTCIQFAPCSEDFKADDKAPGFRWLELYPDGTIETAVERVTDISFPVDLDSQGYE